MQIRSLREDELDDWFLFITNAFQRKENPPTKEYFERHYFSDPWRECGGIFVAVDDGELVCTVAHIDIYRFLKQSSCETSTCGVGEVCTHENFRRRGIARMLLERSLSYMSENRFALSVLHTGTASKLYEGLGWTPVTREFFTRRIPFDLYSSWNVASPIEVCPCESEIFEEECLERLMTVYNRTSVKYNGPIVRDHEDYWKKWVQNESGKICWRDERRTPRKFALRIQGSLAGFVVLQFGSESIRVREWSFLGDQISKKFDIVDFVLSQICKLYGEREMSFTFPAPISDMKRHDVQVSDNTTMYKVICPRLLPKKNSTIADLFCLNELQNSSVNSHVFWDTDRF
ncbi:GCN5-related N-acetyltransferase isoform 2 [Galdieria sulphuraria]|uniref:GCN5-related N-acetyltransferase isoform 2 n=1 Tax=Galdieria sulphuraria TaxID=130081 RepID=M2Y8R5_GALSU|nr:GCN5-related N-acetyltransferase isoform 2 [Galdieria sulphuraria]EME32458.1 GCN5-related N-acetyltransferase isoform 2 [Galdieria sulphuraria]|eukprot:XP_005708978.1 GCN5-related N-acetyltransferase isoform 2 [Galdieria sulphuraria]